MYLIIIIILIILLLLLFIKIFNTYYPNSICNEIKFSDINTDCKYRRWGCCNDKLTPKFDNEGTNCRGF